MTRETWGTYVRFGRERWVPWTNAGTTGTPSFADRRPTPALKDRTSPEVERVPSGKITMAARCPSGQLAIAARIASTSLSRTPRREMGKTDMMCVANHRRKGEVKK